MILYVLSISAITLEAYALILWRQSGHYLLPLVLHMAAAASVALLFYVLIRDERIEQRFQPVSVYCLILVFFFPLLGILATVYLLTVTVINKDRFKKGLYDEYEEYIAADKQIRSGAMVLTGLLRKIRDEVSFEPFLDIIRGNNLKVKEKVVGKLSNMESKESISLLKEALNDPVSEIRFCAAGALVKIESLFSEKIQLSLKSAERRGSASDFTQLGDIYMRYADSGLIGSRLIDHYIELGCQAYKSSLDIDTDQPYVIAKYAEAMIKMGSYRKVQAMLERAAGLWPRHNGLMFLRGQIFFLLGQFDKTVENLKTIDLRDLDEQRRQVCQLWTNV